MKRNINKKIKEAKIILESVGLPIAQQNDMSALTLLALCNLKPDDEWKNANKISLGVSKGIMEFVKDNYKKRFAPNTRETFRRQVLHQFVQAEIVDYNPDNPNLPVNSPSAHYAIQDEFLNLIRNFNEQNFTEYLENYIKGKKKLTDIYDKARKIKRIEITYKNRKYSLSPGKHNILQAAIINDFCSKFIDKGELLYLGDTEKKDLIKEEDKLKSLNVSLEEHGKLPDVIIYEKKRNRLFFIEAVTSHGPVGPKRVVEFENLLKDNTSKKIYVSAFPDFATFKKFSSELAWETEVWIMEIPDHMIHYNGDKFIN